MLAHLKMGRANTKIMGREDKKWDWKIKKMGRANIKIIGREDKKRGRKI